jgi:TetR/AcrR family transcriptional regulator
LKAITHKQECILEAAIRRFAHFGVQKTTLTEIADDLAISKQALFYYFSDKQALIAAVQEKIVGEYIAGVEEEFAASSTVVEALDKLLDARKKLLEQYYMLVVALVSSEGPALNDTIEEVKRQKKEKEQDLVAGLLQKGVASGELKLLDAPKTAALLLDTLSAFAQCAMDRVSMPDPKVLVPLYKKQKEVLHLFYNGLKK